MHPTLPTKCGSHVVWMWLSSPVLDTCLPICKVYGGSGPYSMHKPTIWCSPYDFYVTLFRFFNIVYGIYVVVQYGAAIWVVCALYMGYIEIWILYVSNITNYMRITCGMDVVEFTCSWHTSALCRVYGKIRPYSIHKPTMWFNHMNFMWRRSDFSNMTSLLYDILNPSGITCSMKSVWMPYVDVSGDYITIEYNVTSRYVYSTAVCSFSFRNNNIWQITLHNAP